MGVPIEVSFKAMAECELQDAMFEKLLVSFRLAYKELENTLSLFPGISEVLQSLFKQEKNYL